MQEIPKDEQKRARQGRLKGHFVEREGRAQGRTVHQRERVLGSRPQLLGKEFPRANERQRLVRDDQEHLTKIPEAPREGEVTGERAAGQDGGERWGGGREKGTYFHDGKG